MTGSVGNGVADRFAERAVGERGESVGGPPGAGVAADPELVERPSRRRFTAEYKLGILREWEACAQPGSVGALLRREGLYTSYLSAWRQQRDAGALEGLGRSRGRKPADRQVLENEVLRQRLERKEAENARLRRVIEIQGNVSALLEQMLGTRGEEGNTER